MGTAIVWFRRDLRLADNPALAAALRAHDAVLPVYIDAPDEEAPWVPGAASRWWLHHSLAALDAQLHRRGARLHLLRGPALDALRGLIATTRAEAVYWNRCYEPALVARDTAIKAGLHGDGIGAHSFNAALLHEPWQIATGDGGPYRVFTPYWRKARALLQPRPPLPPPRRLAMPALAAGLDLAELGLLPRRGWEAGLRATWQPGEAGAARRLRDFETQALAAYVSERDRPAHDGTSRLSAHLHFGELSPHQILWSLQDAAPARAVDVEPYLRQLGWREFAHHLLYHFPHTSEHNLDTRFDAFAWAGEDAVSLRRWRQGRTGIPIVDAGMRELWTTGWMHNRVRMLVASFLTKNLRQHWLHGARWFWDTLVDADLANNTLGWQWTAGTGADAAPYFRVFNPVTQGERFDADGAYVRRWISELRDWPHATLHRPWQEPERLRRAGYPAPMVELAVSREAALNAYRKLPRRDAS